MLEVFLVIFLGRKIAAICKQKGRKAGGYVTMFVGLWIGMEIIGGFCGLLLMRGDRGGMYLMALAGAAAGAITSFLIVKSLAPLTPDMTGGFPVMPPQLPYAAPFPQQPPTGAGPAADPYHINR